MGYKGLIDRAVLASIQTTKADNIVGSIQLVANNSVPVWSSTETRPRNVAMMYVIKY